MAPKHDSDDEVTGDFSDINDRPIPMPDNYTGSKNPFTVVAQPDGNSGEPCDNNARQF